MNLRLTACVFIASIVSFSTACAQSGELTRADALRMLQPLFTVGGSDYVVPLGEICRWHPARNLTGEQFLQASDDFGGVPLLQSQGYVTAVVKNISDIVGPAVLQELGVRNPNGPIPASCRPQIRDADNKGIGFGGSISAGYYLVDIRLTDKGRKEVPNTRQEIRFKRNKLKVRDVTGITKIDESTRRVEYASTAYDSDEYRRVILRFPPDDKGVDSPRTALFRRYDDGWRLVKPFAD